MCIQSSMYAGNSELSESGPYKCFCFGLKTTATSAVVFCQTEKTEAADEAVGRFLPPKSREDIYRDLEISRQQAAEGKYQEAGEFLAELRAEYGI